MIRTELFSNPSESSFEFDALFDGLAKMDGKSRLLAGRDGEILAASSCAGDAVRRLSSLKIERGMIGAEPEGLRPLQRLLQVDAGDVDVASFGPSGGGERLLVRSCGINRTQVCLVFMNPAPGKQRYLPDLEELFGLTSCEALIVHELFKGQPPQSIAEKQDKSIHTIRAHIRQCYQKLDVNSREQLWNKIGSFLN